MRIPVLLIGAFLLQPSQWLRGRGVGAQAECTSPSATSTDTVSADRRRLRNDLFCDYDRLVIQPGTTVFVNFYIYRLHLDVHRGFLQMLVDMGWSWYDSRLSWDPSQYSDIKEVVVTDTEIWIPDVEALNSMERDWDDDSLRCLVTSAGNVTCNPVYNMQTNCGGSVRHWPVDSHECVFELASRNHDSREYTLAAEANDTLEVESYEHASQEWIVQTATQTHRDAVVSSNFHFTRLEIRITLSRTKYIHSLTVGVPMIVLPCLVLAQLWVDPRWPGRLMLGCCTVASLCLYLQLLSDTVPDDTQGRAPLIVLFYRNSLVIATLVVLLTVALRGLAERADSPPPWLTGSSSWLLRRVPRPILLLEDDDQDEDGEEATEEAPPALPKDGSKATSWYGITQIVDRITFLVLSITFASLLIAESPSRQVKAP